MATQWSCSECGARKVEIATVCILEEETEEFRDFCFDCGTKALTQRMLKLGKNEIVNGWHFTIPHLAGKQHAAINYAPEVVEY